MNSALMFVVCLILLVVAIAATRIPVREWKDYFTGTKTGLGILKGIVIAIGVAVVIAFSSAVFADGRYFNYASVLMGLDYTKKLSPMCERNDIDDRWTSNLGFRLNIYESDDERFQVNSKYTHHSCMLGVDDKSYDAAGIELEYRFYNR